MVVWFIPESFAGEEYGRQLLSTQEENNAIVLHSLSSF
jgi:hypothetical protein